ncbi:hypothetical protein AMTRI_Chr01g132370 [Amborella trichopoda]
MLLNYTQVHPTPFPFFLSPLITPSPNSIWGIITLFPSFKSQTVSIYSFTSLFINCNVSLPLSLSLHSYPKSQYCLGHHYILSLSSSNAHHYIPFLSLILLHLTQPTTPPSLLLMWTPLPLFLSPLWPSLFPTWPLSLSLCNHFSPTPHSLTQSVRCGRENEWRDSGHMEERERVRVEWWVELDLREAHMGMRGRMEW